MTAYRPRRSALYMPAVNLRAIEKARSLPCDVVILDLEDAVAPEEKEVARRYAAEAVQSGGFGHREVVVRVNRIETPWGHDDLAVMTRSSADAILVPKVSAAADIEQYDKLMGGRLPLWAMIETCASISQLDPIAATSRRTRLEGWVLGTNDLSKEMGCRLDPQRTPIQAVLTLAMTSARAWGLSILDGVYNMIGDEIGFAQQCEQGASFGFDGKTLIHPSQIDQANTSFSPSQADVAWASKVVAAFQAPEATDKGALKVDGQMIERLHLVEAERILVRDQASRELDLSR